MTTGSRKKRLNTAMVGYPSCEQYRVNTKKGRLQRYDAVMRPNISLEWDDKKKGVVSKREQIGLARRQLIPFVEHDTYCHSSLADIVSVPKEIFDLNNLSNVLSYEVWQSHLSDKERNMLLRFLPKDLNHESILQALLGGELFHFGNPFMKWSSSLCLGKLHPDSVVHEEQSHKALRKSYFTNLHTYHHNMIGKLQLWKEKWANRYFEGEFVQNIRSDEHAEARVPVSESKFCRMEDNLAESPGSCSWGSSDLLSDSDNQNSEMAHGESHRKGLNGTLVDSSNGMKRCRNSKSGEKLCKADIRHADGAQYMSYVKISKEQHELFKNSLNDAGGIHPSSLSKVLGIIDPLNVQPFERFEEEEKAKLHAYWIKMVANDIHNGFVSMRKRQTHRREFLDCLAKEIGEKLILEPLSLARRDDDKAAVSSTKSVEPFTVFEGEEGIQMLPPSDSNKFLEKMAASDDLLHEQSETEVIEMTTETEDDKGFRSNCLFDDRRLDHSHRIASGFSHGSASPVVDSAIFLEQQQNRYYHHPNSMDRPVDKRAVEESAVLSEYPRNMSSHDIVIPLREEDPFQGYYDSTATGYVSTPALSLETAGGGDIPFFSPYLNSSDRSELLQSILRRLPDDQNLPECSGCVPMILPRPQQPLTLMTLPLNNNNQDLGGIDSSCWGVPFDNNGSSSSSLLYTAISECSNESRPAGIGMNNGNAAAGMIGNSTQAWGFFGDHEAVPGWMGMEARFLSSWNK